MSDYIENKQSISSNYILHGPVYNGLSNETFDMVNHPKHYNVNGMEAIDVYAAVIATYLFLKMLLDVIIAPNDNVPNTIAGAYSLAISIPVCT